MSNISKRNEKTKIILYMGRGSSDINYLIFACRLMQEENHLCILTSFVVRKNTVKSIPRDFKSYGLLKILYFVFKLAKSTHLWIQHGDFREQSYSISAWKRKVLKPTCSRHILLWSYSFYLCSTRSTSVYHTKRWKDVYVYERDSSENNNDPQKERILIF